MRVHVGPVGQDHRAARRGDPRTRRQGRPQPGRDPDVQHDDDHPRPHRGRGEGEIRRLPQAHQSRGRAGADVGLDRRRFLRPTTSTSRSATSRTTPAAPRWTTSPAPIRTGSGPCARSPQHVGIGGAGPVVVGTPEKVADEIEAWFEQTDVDGLNVAVRDLARRFRGYRRHAGAGTDAARAIQERVCRGHAAREAVRRRAAQG